MSNHYTHLDIKERTLIYWWLKDTISLREMARRLRRHHSTISRELRRNLWFASPNYFPRGAQPQLRGQSPLNITGAKMSLASKMMAVFLKGSDPLMLLMIQGHLGIMIKLLLMKHMT